MERTQEQIVARVASIKPHDVFGTEQEDLIDYLDFEHAKQFLTEKATSEDWDKYLKTIKPPQEMMKGYVEFAFGKAHGERGLSALRSMAHFAAWLWLDGNEILAETIRNFDDYGLKNLRKVCKYLEIDPAENGDN